MSGRFLANAEALDEATIGFIAATSDLARDGDIVVVENMNIDSYLRAGPTLLWNHDYDEPVGVVSALEKSGGRLIGRAELSDISPKAQEVRQFAKSGVVSGISIGFMPLESEPIDPRAPFSGQRITQSELLEISITPVPADVGARITARSCAGSLRAVRSLPAAVRERAWARIRKHQESLKPIGRMSEFELAAFQRETVRARTMSAWAAGQGADRDEQEQRRACVAALFRGSRE